MNDEFELPDDCYPIFKILLSMSLKKMKNYPLVLLFIFTLTGLIID